MFDKITSRVSKLCFGLEMVDVKNNSFVGIDPVSPALFLRPFVALRPTFLAPKVHSPLCCPGLCNGLQWTFSLYVQELQADYTRNSLNLAGRSTS